MRILVGVAVDGRVTAMSLPASVPVAHLLPEVIALVPPADVSWWPRTVAGDWLDPELSLADQGCASGCVITLEEKTEPGWLASHDPVAEIVERGPPVDLMPARSSALALAGLCGVWIGAHGRAGAALAVGVAPVVWALLPCLAGAWAGSRLRTLQGGLVTATVCAGGLALGAAGPLASAGSRGLALDACVAFGVLAHALRSCVTNPFVRVAAGACEVCCFGAVVPLGLLVSGWIGW